MKEQQFKKLLIDMASLGDYPLKDELVSLLKIVGVTFEKTGQFAYMGVWNQCKEYIYLSIIPDKLCKLKIHSKYIEELCYEIYPINEDYALCGVFIKPGTLIEYEDISQEILFDNIHRQIVDEIRNAKYVIWIAMAWFTDPSLFAELVKKKKEGVTIEIVVDDNEKNRNAEFSLDSEFPTHWIRIESLYKNIMHDKFCIIDFQTVIHGTFNWTKAANYNKETISIDNNRTTAESFADEFVKLKRSDLN